MTTHGNIEALKSLPAGTEVDIFTDGAAIPNPGAAGGSFVVVVDGVEIMSGAVSLGHSTNNIAEMTGALKALHLLGERTDLRVTINTDSQYVQRGMTEWMTGWKKNGWRNANKKPVANREIWEALDAEAVRFPLLKWQWVKGHNGHEFNERADQLANAAAVASQAVA